MICFEAKLNCRYFLFCDLKIDASIELKNVNINVLKIKVKYIQKWIIKWKII